MLELENAAIQAASELPSWMPQTFTGSVSERSRGYEIIDFMETFMTVPTGKYAGSLIRLAEWQKKLLVMMFEENENGVLRYQTFLWGVARKNGKSLLLTGIGLYFLAFGGPGHQIIAAARNSQQAGIVFDEAKRQVLNSKHLSKIIKPYKNTLVNKLNGSVFKTIAADADSAQGLGGSVILCDEIHAWERETTRKHAQNFWGALSTSRGNREESIMIGISTAGHNIHGTLLGSLYQRLLKESKVEPDIKSRFGGAWWAVPDDANPMDESVWHMANPNLVEGLIILENLREELESLMSQNNMGYFFRMHLNMWVKIEGESFISSFHWEGAKKPAGTIPVGARVCVGFDGSMNADSTVLVIQDYDTGVLKLWQVWETDGSEDWTVTREEVEASLENLFANYDVVNLWADRSYWDRAITDWNMRWRNKITAIPQTRQRITPLATTFVADIAEKRISHTGEEKLSEYVYNAIRTEDGGYAKQKNKGAKKIDGLVAAVLANGARNFYQVAEMKKAQQKPASMRIY